MSLKKKTRGEKAKEFRKLNKKHHELMLKGKYLDAEKIWKEMLKIDLTK